MDILYLGGICSTSYFDKLIIQEPTLSQAAFKYECQFVSNLMDCINPTQDTIQVISTLSHKVDGGEKARIFGLNIDFVYDAHNSVTSLIGSMLAVYRFIKQWKSNTKNQHKVIITYAVDPTLVLPALFYRAFHRNTKIITICSEVPSMRNYEHMSQIRKCIVKKLYEAMNEQMNGYIFFSKYMNDVCNKKNSPWIAIEGLPDLSSVNVNEKMDDVVYENAIMYAGGLDRGYGVEELIEGFKLISRKDINLIICGSGMLKDTIEDMAKEDQRVSYLGILENRKVVMMERRCSILINPRKPDLALTKYSFPSKTLEYFLNGSAVTLITRLGGIPDEYYDYCYSLDKVTPQHIADSVEKILDEPVEQRKQLAKEAQKFILQEKSSRSQMTKILQFVRKLAEE